MFTPQGAPSHSVLLQSRDELRTVVPVFGQQHTGYVSIERFRDGLAPAECLRREFIHYASI